MERDPTTIPIVLAFGTSVLNLIQMLALEYLRRKYPNRSDPPPPPGRKES